MVSLLATSYLLSVIIDFTKLWIFGSGSYSIFIFAFTFFLAALTFSSYDVLDENVNF